VDGIHDLGGMDGFGPVTVEADEPVFHADWERRLLPLLFVVTQHGGVDAYRHAMERMDPAHYLAATYYERMLTAVLTRAIECGLVTRDALEARAGGRVPLARPVASNVTPIDAPAGPSPRFAVGDDVVVRTAHPRGHTRCPRWARGRRGTVVRVDPAFPVPDVAAHAPNAPREPTYGVRFTARELWGDDTSDTIHVDLWERWLEPA
jgi:nitrile hydratase beta subunit